MNIDHNQNYLLHDQYKDEKNFAAHVRLHALYSTNKYGWNRWVFDHFPLSKDCTVLELGCGPGLLWVANRNRIPAGWQITLTDFSPGMLDGTRQRLGAERFHYAVADAQSLPFDDASVDVVIANHMLYHIPDLPRALAEIRRVLKPEGSLYASTVSNTSMQEVEPLLEKCWPGASWSGIGKRTNFNLEHGHEALQPFFEHVTLDTYDNALEVTAAEPLAAYILSGRSDLQRSPERLNALTTVIQQELDARGNLHITAISGLFVASKKV